MDKKFFVYHLKNEGLTKLLKVKFNCEINIFSNSTSYNGKYILKDNGYNVFGDLMKQIEIYYDSTNKIFYICSNGHNETAYINLGVNIANSGYALAEYEDNFDTTGLTKLNPLNINNAVTNRKIQYSPTITANTVSEYICNTPYKQYMAQCFLVLVSFRNNSNIAGNGLLFFHRICTDSSANSPVFTMDTIYGDNNLSQFSITPTKTGFTFTNTANYRFSITEISNNATVNSL